MRRPPAPRSRLHGFTLVELLVVMAIIAILASLTLGITSIVQKNAARSKARTEISAMETALEKYKLDNSTYPTATLDPFTKKNPNDVAYLDASKALFLALRGTNIMAASSNSVVYLDLKAAQAATNSGSCYILDPFGYAYGYNTATNSSYNTGFFDLWSTSGTTGTKPTDTNQWIHNWSAAY